MDICLEPTSNPLSRSSCLQPAEASHNHVCITNDGCYACKRALHCNSCKPPAPAQLLSCDVMLVQTGCSSRRRALLLTMASQRAQHDVQAQEKAPQVPGAGRPVAAGEAVRGCRDPDVDGGVCGACRNNGISSVRTFVPNRVAVMSPAHAGTDEIDLTSNKGALRV
jgi:hypothetical protein